MMRNWVSEELSRLFWVLCVGGVLGWLLGYPLIGLFIAFVAYLAYVVNQLIRVNQWIAQPKRYDIPAGFGLWGAVFTNIKRLKNRAKKRERFLKRRLAEYQAPALALPDAAIALNQLGEIRWMNAAAEDLFDLHGKSDVGQVFVNLVRLPELVDYLKAGDYTQDLQIALPGLHEKTLLIRVAAYGKGQLVLLAQDISYRIRAEQSQRDFVANVSHELRTPLTVISGYLENLIDSGEIPESFERPLTLMEQQSLRMRHIIEDLLTLAKLDGEKADMSELVDMPALCERALGDVRAISGNHECKVAILTQDKILGDAKQLYMLLSNLLTNAIKYSGDDGLITISWQKEHAGFCLSVTDSGEGIAPHHLSRLTERFYRVDTARSRKQGGTGLGLAIVQSILNQHNGYLTVDSEVGVGSTFNCHFPESRGAHSSVQPSATKD